MEYRIGIIDDEAGKVTQIKTRLVLGFASQEMAQRYEAVTFVPVEILLEHKIEDIVAKIFDEKIQGLIIDYKLSSLQAVDYSGVDVACRIMQYNENFPIFILTAFEEDLYHHTIFSAYHIFDFDRYQTEADERDELHSKMVEQIKISQKMIDDWEKELLELLPRKGEKASIDDRILELDSKLEHAMAAKYAIPEKIKKELNRSSLQCLLDKLDRILEA